MFRLTMFAGAVLLVASLVWYAAEHFEQVGAGLAPDSLVAAAPDSQVPSAPPPGRAAEPLLTLGALGPRTCGARCGVDRWAVKTLSDKDRELVDLRPVPATVESLAGVPRPRHVEDATRAWPVELTTFTVVGCLGLVDDRRSTRTTPRYRRVASNEQDGDIHLVIGSLAQPRISLVAEIPNAGCSGACRTDLGPWYAAATATVDSILRYGPVSRACNLDVPLVRVTGVGFFDNEHGQAGAARNGLELHPVLKLEVLENVPQ